MLPRCLRHWTLAAVLGTAWAMQKGKATIKPRVDADTLAMNIRPAR